MRRVSIVVMVLAAVGCKGKAGEGSGGGGANVDGDMPKEFASWMPKDAGVAWQGAWVSRLSLMHKGTSTQSMAGDPVAFEFAGPKVKLFDGETEATLDYKIQAPCQIEIVQPAPDVASGATYRHHKQFVIVGGKLRAADGGAGYRKGKTAIACVIGFNGGIYTLDDKGTCLRWQNMFHWDSTPATCAWSTADGKDVLSIGTGEWIEKLIANGDVLEDEQFTESVGKGNHDRVADFAAAKAKVTAMDKEHPVSASGKAAQLVDKAKAAGGKVGDTSTVAGLEATFGTDKAALEGKPVEVTGYYVNSSSFTGTSGSNTVTSYNATISNDKNKTELTVTCVAKAEITGFTQWDQVTVKGTVGESFDQAELEDCTVTKAK